MKTRTILVFLALVLASGLSRAELVTDKYFGVARFGTMSGFNFEYAGDAGGAWILIGAHESTTGYELDDTSFLGGYRWYMDGQQRQNNFYGGVVLGDAYGNGSGPRMGLGGEFGYQWAKQYVRFTFSGAIVVLEEIKEGETGDDGQLRRPRDVEPKMLFAFTMNARR